MAKLHLNFACALYDRMQPLYTGEVQPEGIDLNFIPIELPRPIFDRMSGGEEFDVAEYSSSEFVQRYAARECPFVAIPVFPSRTFRHSFISISKKSGIKTPKDLEGKRVGVALYTMTAAIFIRGLLQHEYGVDLSSIKWFEGGVNEGRPADDEMDLRPVQEVPLELIPHTRTLNEMLEAGEIDAYFGARRPAALDTGKNVARLFPDYRGREKEYYQRTGFHPIMHTLVIREDLFEREPWVPESLYKACEESKRWMLRQMRFSGAQRFMFPWLHDMIAEMDELMGANPWPYGLDANRKILNAFNGYLVEQNFLEKTKPIDELFTPIINWTE